MRVGLSDAPGVTSRHDFWNRPASCFGDAPDLLPSRRIRVAGKILRALFILILIVVTVRVASPQIKSLWSIYETPSDLVRLALGLAVCLWLVIHLFIAPKDDGACRTWFYLGLAILPLALITTIVIW
jgi:hypothetical protein